MDTQGVFGAFEILFFCLSFLSSGTRTSRTLIKSRFFYFILADIVNSTNARAVNHRNYYERLTISTVISHTKRMAIPVDVLDVTVLDNPGKFHDKFRFSITFECLKNLPKGTIASRVQARECNQKFLNSH